MRDGAEIEKAELRDSDWNVTFFSWEALDCPTIRAQGQVLENESSLFPERRQGEGLRGTAQALSPSPTCAGEHVPMDP